MIKYREHTQQKIESTKIEFEQAVKQQCQCASVVQAKSEQIDHLVKMLSEVINDGSKEYIQVLEENSKLKTENLALRHIVSAANEFKTVACGSTFSVEDEDEESSGDELNDTVVEVESDVN